MGYRVSGAPAEAEPPGHGHCRAGRKLVTEEADGKGKGSGRVPFQVLGMELEEGEQSPY